jgi:hypothetical protein
VDVLYTNIQTWVVFRGETVFVALSMFVSNKFQCLNRAKAARAERNRRHYLRRKQHRRVFNLELGEAEISLLVRLKWVGEKEAHDPAKITAAVRSLIEIAAKV